MRPVSRILQLSDRVSVHAELRGCLSDYIPLQLAAACIFNYLCKKRGQIAPHLRR